MWQKRWVCGVHSFSFFGVGARHCPPRHDSPLSCATCTFSRTRRCLHFCCVHFRARVFARSRRSFLSWREALDPISKEAMVGHVVTVLNAPSLAHDGSSL
ncbi:hypothetical protein C8F04DRAFT_1073605 [Mycena alexandri]|uniref:Uncharacterized protein n=1 Tax=Mycena alexandri TaxID=1745969 RepID=A0AAD6XF82_9AGAR|nr:hypothetical protein C8F04DRAFT_1073605 [Mycena alexandri]